MKAILDDLRDAENVRMAETCIDCNSTDITIKSIEYLFPYGCKEEVILHSIINVFHCNKCGSEYYDGYEGDKNDKVVEEYLEELERLSFWLRRVMNE